MNTFPNECQLSIVRRAMEVGGRTFYNELLWPDIEAMRRAGFVTVTKRMMDTSVGRIQVPHAEATEKGVTLVQVMG